MMGSAKRLFPGTAGAAIVAVFLFVCLAPTPVGAKQRTLLVHALLIDGTGSAAVADSWVLLEGERIRAVGAGTPPDEKVDEVLDLTGKSVLPGLADMHFHLLGKNSAPWQIKFALAHGITVLRDVGIGTVYVDLPEDESRWAHDGLGHVKPDERAYWTAAYEWEKLEWLRRFLAEEEAVPHFYTAGVMLYGSARQKRFLLPGEYVRQIVEGNLSVGVDFIKVHQWTSAAALAEAIDLANRNGLRTVGHVPAGMTSVAAIDAGMNTLEHIRLRPWEVLDDPNLVARYPIDATWPMRDSFWSHYERGDQALERTLDAWAARKAEFFVDPTLVEWQWETCDYPKPDDPVIELLPSAWQERFKNCEQYLEAGQVEQVRATLANISTFVGLAHRRGIRILAGTDIPEIPGASLHRELELLVGAGLSPVEAIRAATGRASEELGTPERGTIESGKVADLVIVQGNPAENIAAISGIEIVILGGRIHSRRSLLKQAFEFAPDD